MTQSHNQTPKLNQRQPNYGVVVTNNFLDIGPTKAVNGEGASNIQWLTGRDIVFNLGITQVGKVDFCP